MGLTSGGTVQAGYTGGEILTGPVYVERLRQTLWLLADSLAGVLAESGPLVGPFEQRLGPALLAATVVGIEGLARRRDGLLFFTVVAYLLLLPVVNGRFESSVPKARYVAPLLPICYAAMAVAAVETLAWSRRLRPTFAPTLAARVLRGGLGVLVVALLLAPLVGLVDYYQAAIRERRANATLFQVIAGIEASQRPGERVYTERDALKTYTLGGGQWGEHIAFASQVYGWERQALDVPHPRAQIVPVVLPTTKGAEQGTLGLALDPEFAQNRWVYVFYSEADAENRPVRNRLVRFTERDGRAAEAAAILGDLPINQTRYYNGDHNGGRIAFGPDGMLYVSLGEMVRRSQVPDPHTLFGKILRVRPDGTVPPDNPYGGSLTYALGFRNVYGLTFHPTTGQLYATDNGHEGYDELNLVRPGRDYGYPSIESGPGGVAGLEDPLWDSAEERLGITGLTFYGGALFPEYAGDLFFCAFNTGALRRVRLTGPALDDVEWVEIVSRDCRLEVADGPDGTLYFSDLARIFRLSR